MYRFLVFSLLLPSVLSAAKQNLLLITLDTLRADRLGCYGYAGARTPNLDGLARSSLFFEKAVCQVPLTLPSHTSLMTGRYPHHHGVRDNAGTVPTKEITLAEILRQNGYHTYAFVGGFPLDHRFGLNQGFEVYDDTFPRRKHRSLDFRSERGADAVVDAVLNTKLQQPFLVWVHFYDPHAPYLHGGYDGEIEFVDQQIGRLMGKLQAFQPLIAVAGDHGESLGEHSEWTHRIFVYDSTMLVPFWIKGPGVARQRVKSQVRLIDFLPTVLSLLKIPAPSDVDGQIATKSAGSPAYLESMFPLLQLGWSPLAAIRTDEWKYIQLPKPELYDLRSDPQESQNLVVKYPEIVKSLREQIPKPVFTAPQSTISPEMAEQLAALGYVGGASGATSSNIDPKDRINVWKQIEKAVDLETSRPDEAIAALEQARKADPENPMVLGFLAQKYAEADRLQEAKGILHRVLMKDPNNSLALFRMATVSLREGKAAEAKKWAESLLKVEPNNADGLIVLARAHIGLKDIEGAVATLKKVLQLDPRDIELRIDLGNIYLQKDSPKLAKMEFEQVLEADSRNLQALNGLATCLFVQSDLVGSETLLTKALLVDPSDLQTKMNLALLYSKQGKTTKALALYREVASSPNTPADWKAEASSRLKELE